ncbi:hypothetical protein ACFVFQ_29785 [Streptomyces sp. NPDC057743]|uniref:hypothetical protein n=1 Tax=Streptomyces sp. NPDC057743 TaxID=3346236 RepID=UPI0036CDD55C
MLGELTEERVLEVWEQGIRRRPMTRAPLLATLAEGTEREVAGLPVTALNSLLLELRSEAFGDTFSCAADCPGCGESLDVAVSTRELRPPGPDAGGVPVEVGTATLVEQGLDVTYRALTGGDLQAVDPDSPDARRALLRRCVVSVSPAQDPVPDAVLEEVARRLADLDPGADTTVALACPGCDHRWAAAFDVAEHLWADIDAYVRRLMYEVHALARAYGWSEADVLSVSPARRRFYLEVAAQ